MKFLAAATYVIRQPFGDGLRLVREALQREGLSIVAEMDVSGRLKREFGIALSPSRILLVDCPLELLRGMALDSSVAVWLPLHVVVAGRGEMTWIRLTRTAPGEMDGPVRGVLAPVVRALQRIAMQEQPLCSIEEPV